MNRRNFFKLVAGEVLVPVLVKAAPIVGNEPKVWADGRHDDAPGLQALIDGEPVLFASDFLHENMNLSSDVCTFPKNTEFQIKSPLALDTRTQLIGDNTTFVFQNGGQLIITEAYR